MVTRVRTIDFLPEIFKTTVNEQFLSATLDQLVNQPNTARVQGYIGRTFGYGVSSGDSYVVEPTKTRKDYQLEPGVIFTKTDTDKAKDFLTYPGLIDGLKKQGSITNNHNRLFASQYYTWDSFADLDKLINYNQYYWLPTGPEAVRVSSVSTVYLQEDFTVTSDLTTYTFTSIGSTKKLNPIIRLIRGGTYTFNVNQDSEFWIQGQPGVSGDNPNIPSLSVRDVYGVTNNGTKDGTITFEVPSSGAQDEYKYPGNNPVDVVTTLPFSSIDGQYLRDVIDIDGVRDLNLKTVLFFDNSESAQSYNSNLYRIEYSDETTNPILNLVSTGPLPNNEQLNVQYGTNYLGRTIIRESTGLLKIAPYLSAQLPVLYYQDGTDPDKFGEIQILENNTASYINVDRDIVGKKNYTSPNGVVFTNGLKIIFQNDIRPAGYINQEFYVEGVGTAIQLIPVESLEVYENYAATQSLPYSTTHYDVDPYNFALNVPESPDYLTIARNSLNTNAWSRSNRWFHIDVLRATAEYNNTPASIASLNDVASKAKRPIIEFYPNLKLFNYGTQHKGVVDFFDTNTTNAFTDVAGSYIYSSDGADVTTTYTGDSIVDSFTGTGSEDTFTLSRTPTNADQVIVRVNGVEVTSYTITDDELVFDAPPANGAAITVFIGQASFTLSGTVTSIYQLNVTINELTIPVADYSIDVTGTILTFDDAPIDGQIISVTIAQNTLFSGAKVIFANDTDVNVRKTVYVVNYVSVDGVSPPVITLLADTVIGKLGTGDQISVRYGTTHAGLTYYLDADTYIEAQQKLNINQAPLFDVLDENNISFSDTDYYGSSTFAGSKLFAYAVGTGTPDPILGFPLKYSSINNIGDIQFDVTFNTDTFTYVTNFTPNTVNINTGYVWNYQTYTDYVRLLGWETAITETQQYQVLDFTVTELVKANQSVTCDISISNANVTQLAPIEVYFNSVKIPSSLYTFTKDTNSTVINFSEPLVLGTKITVNMLSDQASVSGYYEIPNNLANNPFNEVLTSTNVGDIRRHYVSICTRVPTFSGVILGANNYRDLGDIQRYGTAIIQNSASLVLPSLFIRKQNHNIFNALMFNSREYVKYKSLLIDTVNTSDYNVFYTPSDMLDDALEKISDSKSGSSSFFWSDMIPGKSAYITNSYKFNNTTSNSIFPLSRIYSFSSANYYGVLVYLTQMQNGVPIQTQLVKGVDYTIPNDNPNVYVSRDLVNGDVITVKEYNQTYGSFVPNTPTKLGLYPLYTPGVIYDTTYITPTYFIQGHDGSLNKLYGEINTEGRLVDFRDQVLLEFETRVYNNMKVNAAVPLRFADVAPGKFRTTQYSLEEIEQIYVTGFFNWVGENRIDYKTQYYISGNEFTYNYNQSSYKLDNTQILQGAWRGIYDFVYDTDHPHDRPWEMIGFNEQPVWWEDRYGVAPYTSDNTLLWDNMENGIVYNYGKPYVDERYVRPGLSKILPVDTYGNLLSPYQSVLGNYNSLTFKRDWRVGDVGPAEASYLNSSTWPFDLMRILALTKPASFFNLGVDLDSYKYNSEFDQYLFNDRSYLDVGQLQVYGNGTAKHSYINWIVDFEQQFGINAHDDITELLQNLDVRLIYRLAGFSDKDMLKFYVEKGSPNSTNSNLLIPDDSYSVLLYNNQPFETAVYSSVVVQKTDDGYKVYGNSQTSAYFRTFIPDYTGRYDTLTVGSISVKLYRTYTDQVAIVPYGTEFFSIHSLCEFLMNYNKMLLSQGFIFDDIENGIQIDWNQMIAEILYWVQSGWEVGSTINVNPAAKNLLISKSNTIVESLLLNQQNFVLNQNLVPINPKDMIIVRNDNSLKITTVSEGDVIGYFTGDMTNYEHGIVFDNVTVFNDVIYDLSSGIRQPRLYMSGVKSAEWNGTVDAQGFILNQDNIEEWQQNQKYTKGVIVKYKNNYYTSTKIIQPSVNFDTNVWIKTEYDQIQKGLLPNASTRAYESTIYYDTNKANLENDADLLSFSLIGYRPRNYLDAANLTDITQVNVYKNMIEGKGTQGTLNAFYNANLPQGNIKYDIFENWAIKKSNFGGVLNENFVEFTLSEPKLTGNPSIVGLVQDGSVADLQQTVPLYNIINYNVPISNKNILETESPTNLPLLPSAGFANFDDVTYNAYNYYGLRNSDTPINDLYESEYIWLADHNSNWQLYTPYGIGVSAIQVDNNLNGTSTVTFDGNHNLVEDDLIAIVNMDSKINGYYIVSRVLDLTTIIVDAALDTSVLKIQGTGTVMKLTSLRVAEPKDIKDLQLLENDFVKNKAWVDTGVDGSWEVYTKGVNYKLNADLTRYTGSPHNFGTSVEIVPSAGYYVGDPDDGVVYRYTYIKAYNLYRRFETITPEENENFGYAMASSNGNILAVSKPFGNELTNDRAVYVYSCSATRQTNRTVLQQVITPDDVFIGDFNVSTYSWGKSLALSGDGEWLYIGVEEGNAVCVFRKNTNYTYTDDPLGDGSEINLSNITYTNDPNILVSGSWASELTTGKKIAFEDQGTVYTVVTSKYNSSTDVTTVTLTVPPSTEYPVGAKLWVATSGYSYANTIRQVSGLYGSTISANYDGSRIFVGAPQQDYLDNVETWDYDTIYLKGTVISYDGSTYMCTKNMPAFQEWTEGTAYVRGTYIERNGVFFKCLKNLTSNSVTVATTTELPAYTYDNGTSGVGATITADANGSLTIDGHLMLLGEIVLVKNETGSNTPYNGVYEVTVAGNGSTPFELTRTTSFDQAAEMYNATAFVMTGTRNTNTVWACLNAPSSTLVVGTTAIAFAGADVLEQISIFNYLAVIGESTGYTYVYDRPVQTIEFSYSYNDNSDAFNTYTVIWNPCATTYQKAATVLTLNGLTLVNGVDYLMGEKMSIDFEINPSDVLGVNGTDLTRGTDYITYGSTLILNYPFLSGNTLTVNGVVKVMGTDYTMQGQAILMIARYKTGDILVVDGASIDFVELLSYYNSIDEVQQNSQFGFSVSSNLLANEVIASAPYVKENETNRQGAVYRFTDAGKSYGSITSTDLTDVVSAFDMLINGYAVHIPIGDAVDVAEAITLANIPNITASAADDLLTIALTDTNMGRVNNYINLSVLSESNLGQLGFRLYVNTQVIRDLRLETQGSFGYKVKFNEINSFIVTSIGSDRFVGTTFDFSDDTVYSNDTVFDNNTAQFVDVFPDAGAAYIYDYLPAYDESMSNLGSYVYSQSVNDDATDTSGSSGYGKSVAFKNYDALVGAPTYDTVATDYYGKVTLFKNAEKKPGWSVSRKSGPIVDLDRLQEVCLYSLITNETIAHLDYISPLQGKLLGVVRDNLDYITPNDPAGYSSIPSAEKGKHVWNKEFVGKLWFDTSTTRFVNHNQNDMIYNSEYWGKVFPGSSVAVYSWIESDVSPLYYTGNGIPYDIDLYTTTFEVDNTGALIPKYYFWVRNTNTVFTNTGKELSDAVLETYIRDPQSTGIAYFAPLTQSAFGFYNCKEYINEQDTVAHIGYSTGSNDDVGHSDFELIRSEYPSDFLPGIPSSISGTPIGLYDRYLDSLCGTDESGQICPDINVPKLVRSGISSRPRQTLFNDRFLALENLLTYTNGILAQFPMIELRRSSFLFLKQETVAGSENYAYDTTRYWSYITWWANGYNSSVKPAFEVPKYYNLAEIPNPIAGLIVTVAANSQGKREWYIYQDNTWVRIGLEQGTLEISSLLWDYEDNFGYDSTFYDTLPYDAYPSVETRNILRAINEELFTDEFLIYRNRGLILLFEVIQSESLESQSYMPWLNKTSFVDIFQSFRELKAYDKYQSDNEEFLTGYITEVKPYHVVIKDFVNDYRGSDTFEGDIVDFDLPAEYNSNFDRYITPQLAYKNVTNIYEYLPDNPIWTSNDTYSTWYNNFGLSIQPVDDFYMGSTTSYMYMDSNTVAIDCAYAMSETGVIRIDDELMSYSGIDRINGYLTGVVRGYRNTDVTAHALGRSVYLTTGGLIVLNGGRDYTEPPLVTAYVDTTLYPAPRKNAILSPVLVNGKIIDIEVIDPGEGYVVHPDIIIDPVYSSTFDNSNVNFVDNTVIVDGIDWQTGDAVKYTTLDGSIAFQKMYIDRFYYIRVISRTDTQSVIAFFIDPVTAESNTHRIELVEPYPADYTVSKISLTARAIAIMKNPLVRSNKTTIAFDRIAYRSFINEWSSGEYYRSVYNVEQTSVNSDLNIFASVSYPNIARSTFSVPGYDYTGAGTGAILNVDGIITGGTYIAYVTETVAADNTVKLNDTNGLYEGMMIRFKGPQDWEPSTTDGELDPAYLGQSYQIGNLTSNTWYTVKEIIDDNYITLESLSIPGNTMTQIDGYGFFALYYNTYVGTSTTRGQNYVVGETIVVPGDLLNGDSSNDATFVISSVDVNGGITGLTGSGLSVDFNNSYTSTQGVLLPVLGVDSIGGVAVLTTNYTGVYTGQRLHPAQMQGLKISIYSNIAAPYNTGTISFGSGTGAEFTIYQPWYSNTTPLSQYDINIIGSGEGFVEGEEKIILGAVLGGVTGINDLSIKITQVGSNGEILNVSLNGVAPIEITSYYAGIINDTQIQLFTDPTLRIAANPNTILSTYSSGDWIVVNEPVTIDPSIVVYKGLLYRCTTSNNDVLFTDSNWELLDGYKMNALDRIKFYYEPTINMPGKEASQLMEGLQYPYNTYKGNPFSESEARPLDINIRDEEFAPKHISVTGIAFNGSRYVATVNGPSYSGTMSSTDGENWMFDLLSEENITVKDVVWTGYDFVLVTHKNRLPLMISFDGINWLTKGPYTPLDKLNFDRGGFDSSALSVTSTELNSTIASLDGSLLFAVGNNIVTSIDSILWETRFNFDVDDVNSILNCISYVTSSGYTGYLVVGGGNKLINDELVPVPYVLFSINGTSWTNTDARFTTNSLTGIASDGNFIVVTSEKGGIYYSNSVSNFVPGTITDLSSTTATATDELTNYITVDDTSDFAVDDAVIFSDLPVASPILGGLQSDTIYYITDIISSTEITVSLTKGGDNVAVTTDTGSVSMTYKYVTNINKVAYGNSLFVAVGDDGFILRSTDHINWDVVPNVTEHSLNNIEFVNNYFYATGDENTLLRSSDGITWVNVLTITSGERYIDVIGSEFTQGYGPEELVSGIVSDNLSMNVFTRPGSPWEYYAVEYQHTGFNMQTKTLGLDVNKTASFANVVANPIFLSVFLYNTTDGTGRRIYENITTNSNNPYTYTIDWVAKTITINDWLPSGYELVVEAYEVGNGSQVERANNQYVDLLVEDGVSVIYTGIPIDRVTEMPPIIVRNGVQLVSGVDYNITLVSGNAKIIFNTEFVNTVDYITYATFTSVNLEDPPGIPVSLKYKYSVPITEQFTYDSSNTFTVNGTLGYTNDDNAIVEINGLRLIKDTDYTVDTGDNTITIDAGITLTSDDIISVTTFNDTNTQYLTTEVFTSKKVFEINYIDLNDIQAIVYTVQPHGFAPFIDNMVVIDGCNGATQLNNNTFIARKFGDYGLKLYDLESIPVLSQEITQYQNSGYIWLESNSIVVSEDQFGLAANKSWVTVNGERISPTHLRFNTVQDELDPTIYVNTLHVMTPIETTDNIIVTTMMPSATPNGSLFNITINKTGDSSVYRINGARTWLTQPLYLEDTEIFVDDVYKLIDIVDLNKTVETVNSNLVVSLTEVYSTDIVEVTVRNLTSITDIPASDYILQVINMVPTLVFTGGVANGDNLRVSVRMGKFMVIDGEMIQFNSIDTTRNALGKLMRGVQGTGIKPAYSTNTVVYSRVATNRMDEYYYYVDWNSYTYNTVDGDPLSMSTTQAANFLNTQVV
jgi:hypothetical protein